MGAGFAFTCGKCGYTVQTSGPWEFYRNAKGERKDYGHPSPRSKEAERQGVYGLSGELYCAHCDKVFDVILVEYKEPAREALGVWTGGCEPKDEYKDPDAVKCPQCGSTALVLEPEEGQGIPCPRCKEEQMVGEMAWIS
jgi:DNA-directed RNA polymerase subunit M/transcription elongation factor TFIIS